MKKEENNEYLKEYSMKEFNLTEDEFNYLMYSAKAEIKDSYGFYVFVIDKKVEWLERLIIDELRQKTKLFTRWSNRIKANDIKAFKFSSLRNEFYQKPKEFKEAPKERGITIKRGKKK